jgi:signal transduction histidine kinase
VKKLSLQWRITLMAALLIGATCILMNVLIGYSGRRYMDSIGSYIMGYGDADRAEPDFFDPKREKLDQDLTIVIHGAQESYVATNWYITAAVTLLGGVFAYFLSGHALKPLRTFTARAEKVQPNNLTDMKITEDVLPEFRQFSGSFNQMLERLDEGFTAQRQFTGNAAHELRTPLSLMQAQLELFSAEHPDVLPETADFLRLLREQTERMTQMTKTLLEMSELKTVPCTDRIELAPMVEELFADLAPLAEKSGIILESTGDGVFTGSDTLIYRLLYNLTENAIRYNRPGGTVRIAVTHEEGQLIIRVADTGCGIPEQYRDSIFQPFFRADKSRSRENGGVGLGLSLVWEIVALHGGEIRVKESSERGTTMEVKFSSEAIIDCGGCI